MTEGRALSEAFIAGHPDRAARVLENIPAEEVALFLAGLGSEQGASVLGAMLPMPGAGVLEALPPATAVAILRELSPGTVAGLLRVLGPDRARPLREGLTAGRRAVVDLLLGYPADTFGAWADPGALALRADATAGEARRTVAEGAIPAGCEVYVVDERNRLLGVVRLPDLLGADPQRPLSGLLDSGVPLLPAGAGLEAAHRFPGWERFGALPVVDRRDRFLGTVSLARLRALPPEAGEAPEGNGQALAALTETYLRILGSLLALLVRALLPGPASRRH